MMGDMIWVEVDLEMDGTLTIEEGHEIAVEARRRVMASEPVLDVSTHFDPVNVTHAHVKTAVAPMSAIPVQPVQPVQPAQR
jgi:divalent metal cation (Fe/Co/Zn/Cd) transporter